MTKIKFKIKITYRVDDIYFGAGTKKYFHEKRISKQSFDPNDFGWRLVEKEFYYAD